MGYDRGDSFPFDFPKQMEFHLCSENRKENCHHDHIPFNVKGNGNIVFSVYIYVYKCHISYIYITNHVPLADMVADIGDEMVLSIF